ncbi:hypothetical protein GCM10025867_22300 [Frondihabitans sucicola]|uniref:DUF1707 domain-containing protein n=1 Tax=Frondihabitans sucicola TaxID=1268041 RepID=A0ABN6XYN6_9MICO|nr:hypothetical protein GCM10025867_22300 [Frondihabitans sucicola]
MRLRGADENTIAAELHRIERSLESGDSRVELASPSDIAAQFAPSKPHGLSRGLIVGGGVLMAVAAAAQLVGFVVFHLDFRIGPVPMFILGLPMFLVLFGVAVVVDFRLPAGFARRQPSTQPR